MTKILLVEDDKSLREIYGVRLLAEGYDIVSAGDGEEALAMAIKDRPDLILSDVMMPKISGFDMLDILRSTTETKGIKVIMMTALSSEEQRQRGVSLGADRYLVKSQVGIEDVVRTVHEVLADAPVTAASSTPPAAPDTPAPQHLPTPPSAAPTAPTTHTAPHPVAPRPAATPHPVAPAPVAPAGPPAPAPQPAPVTTPAPAPQPSSPPPAPAPLAPSVLPSPTAPLTSPTSPTAPKQTLASRVIEPLPTSSQKETDFSSLMSQELSQLTAAPTTPPAPAPTSAPAAPVAPPIPTIPPIPAPQTPPAAPVTPAPAPQPTAPSPVAPVATPAPTPTPVAPPAPDMQFEETPLPPSPPQPPVATQ